MQRYDTSLQDKEKNQQRSLSQFWQIDRLPHEEPQIAADLELVWMVEQFLILAILKVSEVRLDLAVFVTFTR